MPTPSPRARSPFARTSTLQTSQVRSQRQRDCGGGGGGRHACCRALCPVCSPSVRVTSSCAINSPAHNLFSIFLLSSASPVPWVDTPSARLNPVPLPLPPFHPSDRSSPPQVSMRSKGSSSTATWRRALRQVGLEVYRKEWSAEGRCFPPLGGCLFCLCMTTRRHVHHRFCPNRPLISSCRFTTVLCGGLQAGTSAHGG